MEEHRQTAEIESGSRSQVHGATFVYEQGRTLLKSDAEGLTD